MIKVPVIFNHHSCEELSEEQKTSLFSGLAETFFCLKNNLKYYEVQPSCEKDKEIKIVFQKIINFFLVVVIKKNLRYFYKNFTEQNL